MKSSLTIRIAGEGGEGVISCGELLSIALARTRHDILTMRVYPAEIKGGPAMFQVRTGNFPVLSQPTKCDVMVAFNEEAISLHKKNLKEDGVLIFDSTVIPGEDRVLKFPAPLTKLASDVGNRRGKNMAALGVVSSLMNLPLELLKELVTEKFQKKGADIVKKNIDAVEAGYKFALENPAEFDLEVLQSVRKEPKVLMSGNETLATGAIAAGCRFFAGYPITPASEILEFMEFELPKFDGICIQTEDEISALASCIGASYAGMKAMTATSGPGLSLMLELVSMASMQEIPVVIVDCQRGGPSTGLPTKTEQSDLLTAIYGGHGDVPKVVLAPATVKDCFYGMVKAFNLAEKYQIPVIMLSDQSLSHRTQTFTQPKLGNLEIINRWIYDETRDGKFQRYKITDNGISPFVVAGSKNLCYTTTGLEHDEYGKPNQTPLIHQRMSAKRHKKLEFIAKEKGFTRRFGDEHAKIGIISWGSTEGVIEEAIHLASRYGYEIQALQLKMLHPLPDDEIREFISYVKTIIVPELNFTGQLAQLLQSRYLVGVVRLNKVQGMPFTPDEILNKIEEVYKYT